MKHNYAKKSKLAVSLLLSLISYQATAETSFPDRLPAVEIKKSAISTDMPQEEKVQEAGAMTLEASKDAGTAKIGPITEDEALKSSKKAESGKENEAKKVEKAKSHPPSISDKHVVYEVGKNKVKNEITVERYDDDEYKYDDKSKQSLGGEGSRRSTPSKFIRGNVVEQGGANSETIQYRYIARGGWLIERFQPYLDRVAIEVRRADSSDLWSSYTELTRTFSYMCLLIATDDGSKRMEKAVAKSIAIHREALSKLRLQWDKKPDNVAILFEQYMQSTFYEDLNRDAIKIPAGSYAGGQYKSLSETYPEEESKESSNPFNAIKEQLTKKK